jgi:hypothetical protein
MTAAHGTNNRYVHPRLQCRCDACREAHTAYQRQYRAAQRIAIDELREAAQDSPPQATDEPQTPPVLLPHVWLQQFPGCPVMLGGRVMTSEGRAAGYQRGEGVGWLPLPIRFAPRTQEGLDQLFDQLIADANRALKGAAA